MYVLGFYSLADSIFIEFGGLRLLNIDFLSGWLAPCWAPVKDHLSIRPIYGGVVDHQPILS
jgi:hypothetical protein